MSLVEHTTGELTYKINGAAMTVHNRIGPGYKEEVYEKALAAELQKLGLVVERQYPVTVVDRDEVVAVFYLDLFVENRVVVEVKAFCHLLTNDERAQGINYLKATGAPVGLLLNFGRRSLDHSRIFPGKNLSPVQRIGRDNVRKNITKNQQVPKDI
ncbi:MAG: GxxExxY protein [Chloroflexi bacterium]|nr:MAG: GxxExxY protein [Chloroflexota bacterium]